MKRLHIAIYLSLLLPLFLSSCTKSDSYAKLLKREEKAVNWYLAQYKVEMKVPEDSVFEIGTDAPFYRMDSEGYVYMQVINPGESTPKPESGDLVYFRFQRQNIKYLYEGISYPSEGNQDNLNSSSIGPTCFVFGDKTSTSTTQWGMGIQEPLKYLGYNSEVNLVLRSYLGFTSDQSQCIPYIINVKYYKPEY